MKTKPGGPRRRDDTAAEDLELRCWRRPFKCGADHLGELKPLGLGLERRDERDPEFKVAARDAWRRLGRRWFNETIPAWRNQPWAALEFGIPSGLTAADFEIGEPDPALEALLAAIGEPGPALEALLAAHKAARAGK